jgi:serine/threonine protein kinase
LQSIFIIAVSDASTFVNRTVLNCLASVPMSAQDDGTGQQGQSHIPAWGWVLIGLAIGFVVCIIISAVVVAKRTNFFEGKRRARMSSNPWSANGAQVLGDEASVDDYDQEDASHKTMVAFGQLRDAWRSRIGEVHGLDFTETIGRGGFANVYKAVWRGTIVGVKLIEHSIDGDTTRNIQREAALSTSVSHPNIVITYKVATVGIADLEQMPHYIEVTKDLPSSSSSLPDRHSSSVGSKIESSNLEVDQYEMANSSESQVSRNEEDDFNSDADSGSELVATLIIMEYCDLGSAHEALFQFQVFTLPGGSHDLVSMLRLLIDVALGLDYLHTVANIIHGDLKPSNILIKSSGSTKRGWIAKLGDFGIAKAMDTGSIQQSMAAARLGGTHGYLSPEIMSGRSAGHESDVYAFGILMWVLCTAVAPFKDVGLGQLAYEVVMQHLRPSLHESGIDKMPSKYIDLMRSCWSADANERPKFDAIVRQLRVLLVDVLDETLHKPDADDQRFLSALKAARAF